MDSSPDTEERFLDCIFGFSCVTEDTEGNRIHEPTVAVVKFGHRCWVVPLETSDEVRIFTDFTGQTLHKAVTANFGHLVPVAESFISITWGRSRLTFWNPSLPTSDELQSLAQSS